MILKFPEEVLKKIFLELINEPSELQYTCKKLYSIYQELLYRLKPVTITSKSQFLRLLNNDVAVKSVVFINVSELSCLKRNGFDQFGGFQNLKVLNVSVGSLSVLEIFLALPQTLTKLTIFINYRHRFFQDKYLHNLEQRLTNTQTTCLLKTLEITSSSSILSTKVNNYLLLLTSFHRNQQRRLSNLRLSHINQRYFETNTVETIDTYRRKLFDRKKLLFGYLMFKCISRVANSLTFLQFRNIDASLIFFHTLTPPKWNFPSLNLFVFDNCSLIRLSTWFERFQLSNQEQRNNKPLFFILIDNLSGQMLTKTALSPDSNWSISEYSESSLSTIKQELCLV